MIKRTLSAIALGGLLLAGCSGGTTEVSRTETPASPTGTGMGAATSPEPVDSASASSSRPGTNVPQPTVPTDTAAPTDIPAPTSSQSGVVKPSDATSSPATSAPATTGGSWVSMDVTVTTPAEAETLTATSADFRAFVAGRVSAPDASGCQSEFTVMAFHPSGFASGQDFAPGCGGSQNIWGIVGGRWETIMAMQSVVECTEMQVNNIPKGIPDIPCTDANGDIVDW